MPWPITEKITLLCLQKYREWQAASASTSVNENIEQKNERSESGFNSINDGIFNNNNNSEIMHISLNIPLPPTRTPPEAPTGISNGDFSPLASPIPPRKLHKPPIPKVNFIDATPSPVLKGNHDENLYLIESGKSDGNSCESEMKIDELNDEVSKRSSDSNVRKGGIIADKIEQDEMENLEIKVYPKDRA